MRPYYALCLVPAVLLGCTINAYTTTQATAPRAFRVATMPTMRGAYTFAQHRSAPQHAERARQVADASTTVARPSGAGGARPPRLASVPTATKARDQVPVARGTAVAVDAPRAKAPAAERSVTLDTPAKRSMTAATARHADVAGASQMHLDKKRAARPSRAALIVATIDHYQAAKLVPLQP